jgi:hypothetical protein
MIIFGGKWKKRKKSYLKTKLEFLGPQIDSLARARIWAAVPETVGIT